MALVTRLVYLADIADWPALAIPVSDEEVYDQTARELLRGRLEPGFFWRPSLYAVWLAALYAVTGGSVVAARAAQLVLGAVACALTCALGVRWFGAGAGLVAGLIMALYGPLIFYEASLVAAGPAALVSVGLVALAWAARDPVSRVPWPVMLHGARVRSKEASGTAFIRCGLLGVVCGLAPLLRGEFLLAGVTLWLWLLVTWRREHIGFGRIAARVIAGVLGFAVVILPVAAACQRVTGRFTFLAASGGINFYVGNHPDTARLLDTCRGSAWKQLLGHPAREGIADQWEQQQWFYARALELVRQDPAGFACRLGRKLLQLVNALEIPRNEDPYLIHNWSWLQRALMWRAGGLGFPFGVVFPLAVIGLAACGRRTPAPLLLLSASVAGAVVVMFVAARFRVPLVPVLAWLAGAGLAALIHASRRRQWRRLVVPAGAGVAAALVSNQTWPPWPWEYNYHAGLHLNLGYFFTNRGQDAAARHCYQEALRLWPQFAEARLQLGNTFLKQACPADALPHLEMAVRLAPDLAVAHDAYGLALLQHNRLAEAEAQFLEALRLDPVSSGSHMRLGLLLLRKGKPAEGLAALRRAVQLAPRDADARLNLARALLSTGDVAGAVEAAHAAVALQAGDARSHFLLGLALEQARQPAAAVQQYYAVLRLAPDHAGARERLQALTGAPQP